MVGLVFGGVSEIFKILLPGLGSYRVSRFLFDFFSIFFAPVGLVLAGVLEIFKIPLPRMGSDWVSRYF